MQQIAQLNVAKLKYAFDDPRMQDFIDRLEDINAHADHAPGFVWRLQTDEGDATAIDFFGADTLVNMSVWEDMASLQAYVYRSAPNEVMAQRKLWFDRLEAAYSVLWWLPQGHIPAIGEAAERLDHLRVQGPSAYAFTFKQNFPSD